jgi:hypothetical protein
MEFVVWGSTPSGQVDQETAEWLIAALSCGRPTKTTLVIAREVVREAQEVDEALSCFVAAPKKLLKPAPISPAVVAQVAA